MIVAKCCEAYSEDDWHNGEVNGSGVLPGVQPAVDQDREHGSRSPHYLMKRYGHHFPAAYVSLALSHTGYSTHNETFDMAMFNVNRSENDTSTRCSRIVNLLNWK